MSQFLIIVKHTRWGPWRFLWNKNHIQKICTVSPLRRWSQWSCLHLRLFHNPLAHAKRRGFACRWGCPVRLSVAFEQPWKFPPVTRVHNAIQLILHSRRVRSTPIYIYIHLSQAIMKSVTPAIFLATSLGLFSSLTSSNFIVIRCTRGATKSIGLTIYSATK